MNSSSDPRCPMPDAAAPVSDPARPQNCRTTVALMAVASERGRQEQLCAAGKFPWTCAHLAYPSSGAPIQDGRRLAVLTEEVGEVAKEINDGPDHPDLQRIFHPTEWREQRLRLRTELIQVAACAAAFIEAIDHQMEGGATVPAEPLEDLPPDPMSCPAVQNHLRQQTRQIRSSAANVAMLDQVLGGSR